MTTSYDVDAYVVELRARITELEAELADSVIRMDGWVEDRRREVHALVARTEKAEARVGELEAEAESYKSQLAWRKNPTRPRIAAREAREREEG